MVVCMSAFVCEMSVFRNSRGLSWRPARGRFTIKLTTRWDVVNSCWTSSSSLHNRWWRRAKTQVGDSLMPGVVQLSLSLRSYGHFTGGPGLADTRMTPFWILLELRGDGGGGGDKWSYNTLQSSSQIITTNKPTPSFLQAECPSCRPTNSVTALKVQVWTDNCAFGAPTVMVRRQEGHPARKKSINPWRLFLCSLAGDPTWTVVIRSHEREPFTGS